MTAILSVPEPRSTVEPEQFISVTATSFVDPVGTAVIVNWLVPMDERLASITSVELTTERPDDRYCADSPFARDGGSHAAVRLWMF